MSYTTRRMVIVRMADAVCAVAAAELVAIDRDDGARIAVDGTHDLSAKFVRETTRIAQGSGAHLKFSTLPSLRLIVEISGRLHAIRACCELELVETAAVYRLPRLLRDVGCAPWLLGLVLAATESGGTSHPMPWIDLARCVQPELS